jgi:hypothetical protein
VYEALSYRCGEKRWREDMGAARDGRERDQGGEAGGRGGGHALGGGDWQKRNQLEICPTKNCKIVLRKLPPETQVFFFGRKFVVALTKPVACSAEECLQARHTLN